MYRSVPSLSVGMNSVPSCDAGYQVTTRIATASRIDVLFQRITHAMIGR